MFKELFYKKPIPEYEPIKIIEAISNTTTWENHCIVPNILRINRLENENIGDRIDFFKTKNGSNLLALFDISLGSNVLGDDGEIITENKLAKSVTNYINTQILTSPINDLENLKQFLQNTAKNSLNIPALKSWKTCLDYGISLTLVLANNELLSVASIGTNFIGINKENNPNIEYQNLRFYSPNPNTKSKNSMSDLNQIYIKHFPQDTPLIVGTDGICESNIYGKNSLRLNPIQLLKNQKEGIVASIKTR